MSENLLTFEEGKKIQQMVKNDSNLGDQISTLDMALGGNQNAKRELANFIKSKLSS